MGQLIDAAVTFPGSPIDRSLMVVLLVDGPCAGRYETVTGDAECWARVGKPGGVGVETQMWSRYDPDPRDRSRRFYSGITITTDQLAEGLRAARAAGETYGESYGA